MCHWCQKIGHLIAECRAKAAGKPKTKPGMQRLDENQEWFEDCSCIGADALSEACVSGNGLRFRLGPMGSSRGRDAGIDITFNFGVSPTKLDPWSGAGSSDPLTNASAEATPT